MIVYVENPKESTQKNLLEPVSDYHKVAGYKVHAQKSVFLRTKNEWGEFEI